MIICRSRERTSEQRTTEDKGKPLGTLEDRHESWDALGLLQSDGAPWVTPIRPGGICRILDLMCLLVRPAEKSLLLASSDLDFVRAIYTVLWRDNRGVPPAGNDYERGLGKTPSDNALFFDQDVRADCSCLVEESRTTRTEEFRDVDSGRADKLIFTAHGDFVRRHGIV